MKHVTSLAVILGTTLLTALLAAPVIGPDHLQAEDETQVQGENLDTLFLEMAAPNQLPIEAGGLVISLKLDRQKYAAGQKPVLTLTATNEGGEAQAGKITVHVYSQEPMDFMVRSMPMPQEVLTKEVPLEIEAESSGSLTIETDHALVAGKLLTISIQVGDTHYSAGGISVPAVAAPVRVQETVKN